jgi:TrpR-related protein YerC/YecD
MPIHHAQSSPPADELFRAILSLQSMEECYRFFSDLLTVQELNAFVQRLQVAKMLSNGMTYDKIRGEVSTSSSTITRINTELRYGSGGYQMVLERLAAEQNQDDTNNSA